MKSVFAFLAISLLGTACQMEKGAGSGEVIGSAKQLSTASECDAMLSIYNQQRDLYMQHAELYNQTCHVPDNRSLCCRNWYLALTNEVRALDSLLSAYNTCFAEIEPGIEYDLEEGAPAQTGDWIAVPQNLLSK